MAPFIIVLFILSGCSFCSSQSSHQSLAREERFYGKVKLGMTKEQVVEKWGEPAKIIKKRGKDYDEIWVFIPHWKFRNYLYFKDGVLIRGDPNPETLV